MHKLKKKNPVFLWQIFSPYLHLKGFEFILFIFMQGDICGSFRVLRNLPPATSKKKIDERELVKIWRDHAYFICTWLFTSMPFQSGTTRWDCKQLDFLLSCETSRFLVTLTERRIWVMWDEDTAEEQKSSQFAAAHWIQHFNAAVTSLHSLKSESLLDIWVESHLILRFSVNGSQNKKTHSTEECCSEVPPWHTFVLKEWKQGNRTHSLWSLSRPTSQLGFSRLPELQCRQLCVEEIPRK